MARRLKGYPRNISEGQWGTQFNLYSHKKGGWNWGHYHTSNSEYDKIFNDKRIEIEELGERRIPDSLLGRKIINECKILHPLSTTKKKKR